MIALVTILAFLLFFAAVAVCVVFGYNMLFAVIFGALCFMTAALLHRFALSDILKMMLKGGKTAVGVVINLVFIGALTGLWRSSGTIAFFVYYGIKIIPPNFFLTFAFLIPAFISYMIGTCYGTTGTIGVVLLVLGTAGGVPPTLICGAVVSGAYFGDRCALTAGNANLVAATTNTNVSDNLKYMLKEAAIPTVLTALFFSFLSLHNPASRFSDEILSNVKSAFNINLWLVIPALFILVLPLFRVSVKKAMGASIAAAFLVSVFVQKMSVFDALKTALFGFKPESSDGFIRLFAGGGLLSMVTVMLLVFISSTYSGIFNGTRMLDSVEDLLEKVAGKIGVFPTTLVSAVFANFAACSQTLAVILQTQLLGPVYRKRKINNTRFALDVANTTSIVAGLVPWSISFTVPVVGMLGGTVAVIPYLAFLYITPLWSLGRYYVKKSAYKPQE